eukprot:692960_1
MADHHLLTTTSLRNYKSSMEEQREIELIDLISNTMNTQLKEIVNTQGTILCEMDKGRPAIQVKMQELHQLMESMNKTVQTREIKQDNNDPLLILESDRTDTWNTENTNTTHHSKSISNTTTAKAQSQVNRIEGNGEKQSQVNRIDKNTATEIINNKDAHNQHVHPSEQISDNSRDALRILVTRINGDSSQIQHQCTRHSLHKQWHCVCTVSFPFKKNAQPLQTVAQSPKKKDVIEIASKLMIKQILKQPPPITNDIHSDDDKYNLSAIDTWKCTDLEAYKEAMRQLRWTDPKGCKIHQVPNEFATEAILKSKHWFGKFGTVRRIEKKRHKKSGYTVWVNYETKKAATKAMTHTFAANNHRLKAMTISTQYCHKFIEGKTCKIPTCTKAHQWTVRSTTTEQHQPTKSTDDTKPNATADKEQRTPFTQPSQRKDEAVNTTRHNSQDTASDSKSTSTSDDEPTGNQQSESTNTSTKHNDASSHSETPRIVINTNKSNGNDQGTSVKSNKDVHRTKHSHYQHTTQQQSTCASHLTQQPEHAYCANEGGYYDKVYDDRHTKYEYDIHDKHKVKGYHQHQQYPQYQTHDHSKHRVTYDHPQQYQYQYEHQYHRSQHR